MSKIHFAPFAADKAYREWACHQEAKARSPFSARLIAAYKIRPLRRGILSLACRLEGGHYFSATLRDILRIYHGVEVGQYSYGGCLEPGYLPPGTRVGNYCSISSIMLVYRRNHPPHRLSQHPFFFNHEAGLLEADSIEAVEQNPLTIGHDVWIGHQVVILPNCRTIGDGAIIGAGSIVTKDVEPFTIVAGNPARVIGQRFPEKIRDQIIESRWWMLPLPELVDCLDVFLEPATSGSFMRSIRALRRTDDEQDLASVSV